MLYVRSIRWSEGIAGPSAAETAVRRLRASVERIISSVHWTGDRLELSVHARMSANGVFVGCTGPNDTYMIGTDQSPSPEDEGLTALSETLPGVIAVGKYYIAMRECRVTHRHRGKFMTTLVSMHAMVLKKCMAVRRCTNI